MSGSLRGVSEPFVAADLPPLKLGGSVSRSKGGQMPASPPAPTVVGGAGKLLIRADYHAVNPDLDLASDTSTEITRTHSGGIESPKELGQDQAEKKKR